MQRQSYPNYVHVFSFGCTVLLVCMRAGDKVDNTGFREERVQLLILPSPIRLGLVDG
jgi:hypothetical protein